MPQPDKDRVAARISATTLDSMLKDSAEIALIDVREVSAFSQGHLWLANNLPLSRLELRIRRFVPRLSTRIVLCDQDETSARDAVTVLSQLGYSNLHILQGGVPAWTADGYALVKGNYVIAHAFGYFLEDHYHINVMTADELKQRQAAGENTMVADARAESDYRASSLPESISVPAAEGIRRIPDLLGDEATPIVVHCAGITRAALGAQGLLSSGIQNPVYSLRNGTRGWVMAGEKLRENQPASVQQIRRHDTRLAVEAAGEIAEKFKLDFITHDQIQDWQRQHPDRTCYLIDVRSEKEYLCGHYPGAMWVPGGELAGMTIDHLATQRARLCLIAEHDCARAEITASWMKQLGWSDIVILKDWRQSTSLDSGPEENWFTEIDQIDLETISAAELEEQIETGHIAVIDFSCSESYRAGHIPGAVWASRVQLVQCLENIENSMRIVTTSATGKLARLAANELQDIVTLPVACLEGGNESWCNEKRPLETGFTLLWGKIDDVDKDFVEPQGADNESKCAWHQRCIDWRDSLYKQFRLEQPHQFLAPP